MAKTFTYRDLTLTYEEYGAGQEVILFLPGFGRPAHDCHVFLPLLSAHQRIVAVNLFAHEGSTFPESRLISAPLRKTELAEMMSAFIRTTGSEHIHLVAYSLGGRLALTLCEMMPEKIRTALLIAPDGLKKNWLYAVATGTRFGRSLYLRWADDPSALFRLAGLLNKIGLLSDKLHRFVHVHMETRHKRMQVYETWMCYRKIFPNLRRVSRTIKKYGIRTRMIFGRFDSVIRTSLGRKFVRISGDQTILHIVPLGHRMLTEVTVEYIRSHRLWP